jgi:hypothetical protein
MCLAHSNAQLAVLFCFCKINEIPYVKHLLKILTHGRFRLILVPVSLTTRLSATLTGP